MITPTSRRLMLFAVASSLAWAMPTQADTTDRSFKAKEAQPERGFLVEKYRDKLSAAPLSEDSWLSRLCDYSERESNTPCPSTLPAPSTYADIDQLSTGAPNLRLRIALTSMQNTVVAGSGIDSPFLEQALITWKFESLDADESIPTLAGEAFGLFAPLPDTTIEAVKNHYNGLYQGLILNGCMGTPSTYALTLQSQTRNVSGDVYGTYTGSDEVVGWGWNGLDYTFRATDPEGNASDFRIKGTAYADCVFDETLAQTSKAVNELTFKTADRILDKTESRYISAIEVERAQGRYALDVPGVGEIRILSITSTKSEKSCLVDRQSLINELQAAGTVPGIQAAKKKKTKMKGTSDGNGGVICDGAGEGCTVLTTVWDPDDPILPK